MVKERFLPAIQGMGAPSSPLDESSGSQYPPRPFVWTADPDKIFAPYAAGSNVRFYHYG
jgi:hypothetical protein